MDAARFTYERTAGGWRLQSDEPGLGGPLEGAFRYELRLGDLPADVAVVGHVRVTGLWCVFARDGGSPVVRGIALRGEQYEAHGYDPFTVAAELIESRSAGKTVTAGDTTGLCPRPGFEAQQHYLVEAHRRFLLGSLSERQSPYCSVLPPGFPRRLSPLSAFVLAGGRPSLDPGVETTGGGNHDETARDRATQPTPTPPPVPDTEDPTPDPAHPSPLPASEARDTDGAAAPERERDADDALARAALRIEIERLQRDLARRLRALWVALVIATALLAAALATGLWWTSQRLRRADPIPPASTETSPHGNGSWLP